MNGCLSANKYGNFIGFDPSPMVTLEGTNDSLPVVPHEDHERTVQKALIHFVWGKEETHPTQSIRPGPVMASGSVAQDTPCVSRIVEVLLLCMQNLSTSAGQAGCPHLVHHHCLVGSIVSKPDVCNHDS